MKLPNSVAVRGWGTAGKGVPSGSLWRYWWAGWAGIEPLPEETEQSGWWERFPPQGGRKRRFAAHLSRLLYPKLYKCPAVGHL